MDAFLQSALGSPAARSKSWAAAAGLSEGEKQVRDKENRTPPRKLTSERAKPAQLPHTPGRTGTLRSIVLEAMDKEDAGDADGALAAYMAALRIVPGEPRLLRRVAAVGSQARAAKTSSGLAARRALDSNNSSRQGSGGADLLHDALCGVTMPSSVRKLPRGSAVATAVVGTSSGTPPLPRSPLSRAVAVVEDEHDEAFEHQAEQPVTDLPRPKTPEVSFTNGGRVTSPGAAAAATGERSAGGSAGNREMRAALERQVVDILNTAPAEELMALHGVGVVRAQRIVAARGQDGPFVDLSDLRRIGLYDKQIQRLARQNVLERLDLP